MEKEPIENVMRFMVDKRDLYEAILRNGIYLPKYTSKVVKLNYLQRIVAGEIACIEMKDMRECMIIKPPPKKQLFN